MQFRKRTSILLAFLVLFSNLGLAINVHYCKEKIAGISFTTQVEEICIKDMKSCCAVKKSHDNCCSNKIIEADNDNEEILSSVFKIEFQKVFITAVNSIKINTIKVFDSKKEIPSFYCDSNAPPFYKLYCQLVLYA